MSDPDKQQVINAIGDLKYQVTVADVAAKTGLPLAIATFRLNEVASETGGNLKVADTGDILYCFSPAFQTAYLATGFKKVIGHIGQTLFDVGYYLLKISFGIVLIASLITVAVLIIIVIIAALSKGGDSGGGGGGGGDSGSFELNGDWFPDLLNFFSWNYTPTYTNYNYWGSYENQPMAYNYRLDSTTNTAIPQPEKKGSFLTNCYSYLFGEGDPNAKYEEHKWQVIAEFIRYCQGVVTAEQLAPYTGSDPIREDQVLPVLVRFNGRPEVTESGNIVYVFPSMQITAQEKRNSRSNLPAFLEEEYWTFTGLSGGEFLLVFVFALLNFCGSFWLWTHMNTVAALHPFTFLIRVLAIYGAFFIGFPILRFIGTTLVHMRIAKRNDKRKSYYEMVASPTTELQKKLEEARWFKQGKTQITQQHIAYDSEKDLLEQEIDQLPKPTSAQDH
jgi:hypothetical protein